MRRPMTMGDIHKHDTWVWVYCEHQTGPDHRPCGHSAPMAIAPLVIRWGPDASSDMLRRSARCTKCGGKGATIRTPSWGGNVIGISPFPVERMTNGRVT
jgi:hypothetical protein